MGDLKVTQNCRSPSFASFPGLLILFLWFRKGGFARLLRGILWVCKASSRNCCTSILGTASTCCIVSSSGPYGSRKQRPAMTSLTRSLLWMGTWHACGNGRLPNYLLQVGAVFDWWFGRDGVNVNLFSPFLCMSSATATCSESFGFVRSRLRRNGKIGDFV